MATGLKLKKEEYTTLGDFIMVSFERDQTLIMERFPKLNQAFKNEFAAKLLEVKTLESALMLTQEQKNATQSLYQEVGVVNKELNFLSVYCKEIGINTKPISDLKKDLSKGNVEGAILKIEGVKQIVVANQAALVAEGMAANFATTLENHKSSLEAKNTLQNTTINIKKALTDANKTQYLELYDYIAKIMKYGKLVFTGSILKDEYTISKVVSRMRVR